MECQVCYRPYQSGMEGEYAISFLEPSKATQRDRLRVSDTMPIPRSRKRFALRGELARRHIEQLILVTSTFHSRGRQSCFDCFVQESNSFRSQGRISLTIRIVGGWITARGRFFIPNGPRSPIGTVGLPEDRIGRMLAN